jgi:CDP-4-dehydro-6-deoxyglucose reductase
MENSISVSKAAKLLGMKRSELSQRLSAADISTFEGEVDFEKVKCISPSLDLSDPEILDRVKYIRENMAKTFANTVVDHDGKDLSVEVQKLTKDLMIETQTANNYRDIINDLAGKLADLQKSDIPEQRDVGFALCQWLRDKICAE